ncbi:MAG: branched-chain amino acid aminotransferase [Lachnospiraceae bacterium]|nr:branched-chain amino acid aminotransferase [Lachnospiraceae bacterium]
MEIRIEKNPNPAQKPTDESKLGFGRVFTDHMFVMDWYKGKGWEDARIIPFGNLSVHPASTVFHYAVEIFEGLKAYRAADGSIRLFRPIENARRLNNSAIRMAMPTIPEEDIVQAIETLVTIDKDWVPHEDGTSLYIRPFMMGDDEHLGVHGISHARFMIILSPSGAYYPEGMAPVKIMIEDEDVRAVRGGTGFTKCGGNYAASLRAGDRAEEKGFTQVLWLDGVERKYIEEVGAMNIMFKINGKVVTPELNGSILPGITRKSILELLRKNGIEAEERKISIDEVMECAENGSLEEVWGCGTAAVVSPVGWLAFEDKMFCINNGEIGELTQKLYDELTAIQWGKKEDPFGWTYTLVEG